MPLSEHEQRLLDEMERNLYQNDADFVAAVGNRRGKTNYRAIVLGVLLAIVGLAVLVTGVIVRQPIVGIVGFALMLGGVIVAMRPTHGSGDELPDLSSGSTPRPARGANPQSGFMDRLNERWDNRGDGRS
ncbi:DUF3040 domain-containing protein [Microbacteriaceae bacterium VKM Ac-2854]|nr:DUF3040 domain-containing protein [Microbacteriaceae bacterium VKM Ac-2854]